MKILIVGDKCEETSRRVSGYIRATMPHAECKIIAVEDLRNVTTGLILSEFKDLNE